MTRLKNPTDGLPSSFNALDKWSSFISEVPDQGWCGASWVLSTTSVASDRFAIQSKGKENVQLSAQNILSCTRRQQGCEGGHLDAAWRYLHKKGVVDEACYPYTQQRDTCKIRHNSRSLRANGCSPVDNVDRDTFYTVGPAYSLSREADIMAEIYHSGPVQATMRVNRDFFAYSGGVYRQTAANRRAPTGFHSVKLVGWGEEHNGDKYWVSKILNFMIYLLQSCMTPFFLLQTDRSQLVGSLVGRARLLPHPAWLQRVRHRGVRAGLLAFRLQLLQREVGLRAYASHRAISSYAETKTNLSHASKFSICCTALKVN